MNRGLGNMGKAVDVRGWLVAAVFGVCCALGVPLDAKDIPGPASVSALDRGFAGLYNLDFGGAQQDFAAWQRMHPEDPMGPVSEAAGYLFSEFNRLGVLEAQFYENDAAFDKRPKLTPDPALHARFLNAIS